jgi:hypothetical protein
MRLAEGLSFNYTICTPLTQVDFMDRSLMSVMLSSVMKRLKTLPDCNLPLAELLKLVRREHLPFAANFSTTFIDIVWERQKGKGAALTAVLFESILDWPLHSAQSNALLTYTWQVVEHFPSAIGLLKQEGPASATSRVEELKHILSDYFLDACLIYARAQTEHIGAAP